MTATRDLFTATTSVDIAVRHYELDTQGHVNSAVYLQYGEHARLRHLATCGVDLAALERERRTGVVLLELTIKYLRELRQADVVTVTCAFCAPEPGGKTMRFHHDMHRADGVAAAQIDGVAGLFDLRERRLIADPHTVLSGGTVFAPGDIDR